MHILIIGAGLAGLTCARLLQQHGLQVTVVEASDGVGGRVRSDYANGYTFDRGFQVLFTAYPAVQRQLDLAALDLRAFDPGAIICFNGRRSVLTDPLRDRDYRSALAAATTTIVSPIDKLRALVLALRLKNQSVEVTLAGEDTTTHAYLQQLGFSQQMIDLFFRPFYGGIFLNRSLETSAKCFRFNFKMLSEGQTVIPAIGMGKISQQIAAPLISHGAIKLDTKVEKLIRDGQKVVGVVLTDGTQIDADVTILATEIPEAERLAGVSLEIGSLQTITLYFCGDTAFYHSKKILLNAYTELQINNAQLITNIAPTYAPAGKHLLSATILGIPLLSDETLYKQTLYDLHTMFTGDKVAQASIACYQPLRLYRIPYAQFTQPAGMHPHLPNNRTAQSGLYFAAEFTEASSLNAAMISGEKCAAAIIADISHTL